MGRVRPGEPPPAWSLSLLPPMDGQSRAPGGALKHWQAPPAAICVPAGPSVGPPRTHERPAEGGAAVSAVYASRVRRVQLDSTQSGGIPDRREQQICLRSGRLGLAQTDTGRRCHRLTSPRTPRSCGSGASPFSEPQTTAPWAVVVNRFREAPPMVLAPVPGPVDVPQVVPKQSIPMGVQGGG